MKNYQIALLSFIIGAIIWIPVLDMKYRRYEKTLIQLATAKNKLLNHDNETIVDGWNEDVNVIVSGDDFIVYSNHLFDHDFGNIRLLLIKGSVENPEQFLKADLKLYHEIYNSHFRDTILHDILKKDF